MDIAEGARPGILRWIPVRLAIFCGALAFVAVLATLLTRALVPPAPSPWHQLVMVKNLLLPIAELGVYAALVRWLEHRPASEVALGRGGLRFLGLGLVIGSVLIAAVVLVLWWLGLATVAPGTGAEGLLAEVLVPFATATIEEILFRAILFRLFEAMFGTTPAALLSTALFGLAHVGNPGATGLAISFLALDLGLLLAIAFAASRSLWLPVGIHFAWNFALGFLFGASNSGMADPHSLLRTTFRGPSWLSGGSFGLEGSAMTLLLSSVLTAALFALARRDGQWQALRFQLRERAAHG